jgi:hypothetical protein
MSPLKAYFVRNIVLAAGRQNLYTKDMSKYEKEAMDYNRRLRARVPRTYY